MAIDWIKRRAAEARQDERSERWQLHKERVIESHSHEFFASLTELMERSVAEFNAEFQGDPRGNLQMQKGLNRFTLRHAEPPAITLECRLDYAAHAVRYRVERESRHGRQKFHQENTLKFDMTGGNRIQLLTVDSIPLTLEQTTQQMLEPFF